MNDSTMSRPRYALARSNATASAASPTTAVLTPLPWLPSSGFTTTGPPMRRAAACASSSVSTVRPFGTGRPASASSALVSSLSLAMLTAM